MAREAMHSLVTEMEAMIARVHDMASSAACGEGRMPTVEEVEGRIRRSRESQRGVSIPYGRLTTSSHLAK